MGQSAVAQGNVPSSRGSSRVGSSDDEAPSTSPVPAAPPSQTPRGLSLLDYPSYMARLLATEEMTPLGSPGASSAETSPTIKGNVSIQALPYCIPLFLVLNCTKPALLYSLASS